MLASIVYMTFGLKRWKTGLLWSLVTVLYGSIFFAMDFGALDAPDEMFIVVEYMFYLQVRSVVRVPNNKLAYSCASAVVGLVLQPRGCAY